MSEISEIKNWEERLLAVLVEEYGGGNEEWTETRSYRRVAGTVQGVIDGIAAEITEAVEDPYLNPVQIDGHSHAEPICCIPECESYLTPTEMMAARISEIIAKNGGRS